MVKEVTQYILSVRELFMQNFKSKYSSQYTKLVYRKFDKIYEKVWSCHESFCMVDAEINVQLGENF